jgi:ABC-type uncharacterized transport system permease subunit
LLGGALGTPSGLMQSESHAAAAGGLGIVIAFRANVINIGGEPDHRLRAGLDLVAVSAQHLAGLVLLPATLGLGFLAGALWALCRAAQGAPGGQRNPGTVMMNAIALQLMNYLLIPADRPARSLRSPRGAGTSVLPRLGNTPARRIVLAPLLAGRCTFLWHTTLGYRIRAVTNPDAARWPAFRCRLPNAGAEPGRGFAGLAGWWSAGASPPAGGIRRLRVHGIVAPCLASCTRWGDPAAFFFGSLLVGPTRCAAVQVPLRWWHALLGVVVLFVVGAEWWARRRTARRQTASAEGEQPTHA